MSDIAAATSQGISKTNSPVRFHTLDGLRGVAAIAVCASHIAPAICHIHVLRNWFAVDLFFMISGFVLCRSYEERFRTGLSVERFMVLRFVRVYPLFAIGVLIGIAAEALALLTHQSIFSPGERGVAIVSGLLLLPSLTMRATPEIIPLNPVGWSLFFELVINLVYVVFWRRLGIAALTVIVALSGCDLLWLASHNLSFGGTGWPSFWGGFPRISFCFFLGILMARTSPAVARPSRFAYLPVIAFVALLFLPWEDMHVRDTLIMMIALPAVLFWAVRVAPRHTVLFDRIGAASYPIYAIHYPAYALLTYILAVSGRSPESLAPWGGILFLMSMFSIAILLERGVDRPLRRRAAQLIKRRQTRAAHRGRLTA